MSVKKELKILLFLFLSILAVSCKPHRKTYGSVEAKNVLYTDHTEDFPVVFNNTVINKKDIDKLIGYHRKLYRNYLVCHHQVYYDKSKNKAWLVTHNKRRTDYVLYEISDETYFPETRIVKSFNKESFINFVNDDFCIIVSDDGCQIKNIYTNEIIEISSIYEEMENVSFFGNFVIVGDILVNRFNEIKKDISNLCRMLIV